ncbi:hypothetical protein LCGC14_2842620 [marine sediment metagenome]|uniref:Hemerythrin-like domain-containing protein n=1 Tax=marine sediment metagenome TaxID=412755 RepID=A0A0F8YAY7_9ZZZZ
MTRTEIIDRDMKMSDIILKNHLIILVLERFEIDLGFKDKSVEEVCKDVVNVEVFLTISNLFNNSQYNTTTNFNYKDTQTIIQFLKNSHKYYLEEKYPEISNNIQLMIKKNSDSEILMVERFFEEYKNEVVEHLAYENDIVFPYIIALFDKAMGGGNKNGQITYSVRDYKEHHNDIEEKLADLKNLLIKYLPQKKDKEVRRKILFDLFELEYDLSIHAKIEENILIPLVESMENDLKNNE